MRQEKKFKAIYKLIKIFQDMNDKILILHLDLVVNSGDLEKMKIKIIGFLKLAE